MIIVVTDQLAFDEKSIYSLEKFHTAKGLMYW